MLTYNQCKDFKNIDKSSGRVYDTPKGFFPSVTTVLKATANMAGIEAWKLKVGEEEAQRILTEASARGTLLHSYLERFYLEYSEPNIEDARNFIKTSGMESEAHYIQVMIKETMKHLLANNFRSIAQEFVVWDTELELAGRCDNLGYWQNALTLVDFKTARKAKQLAYVKDYFLQATAYCKAHNRMFEDQIKRFVIIIANEEGGSQIFTGNPSNYIPELRYRVNKYYAINRLSKKEE